MILITGPMRSGTSALAEQFHRAGVLMGTTLPMLPAQAPEWEDAAIVSGLTYHLHQNTTPTRESLVRYLWRRREHFRLNREAHADGLVRGFGLKSPFLAIYWREMEKAAAQAGEPLVWIQTMREKAATYDSLDRQVERMAESTREATKTFLYRIQHRIFDSLDDGFVPDHGIDHKDIRDPAKVASLLETVLGGA